MMYVLYNYVKYFIENRLTQATGTDIGHIHMTMYLYNVVVFIGD